MRYCSNCRRELQTNDTSCPECGVYAGDLYDGKAVRRERRPVSVHLLALLLLASIAAGYAVWMNRFREEPEAAKVEAPPVRVVKDRPGGSKQGAKARITEAEAIRVLVAHLVETRGMPRECIVVMSKGYRDGAYQLSAYQHCEKTRLGQWKVDGGGRVSR